MALGGEIWRWVDEPPEAEDEAAAEQSDAAGDGE